MQCGALKQRFTTRAGWCDTSLARCLWQRPVSAHSLCRLCLGLWLHRPQCSRIQADGTGTAWRHCLVDLLFPITQTPACEDHWHPNGLAAVVGWYAANYFPGTIDICHPGHNVPVSKLMALGLHDVIVWWICSFLSHRRQHVKISDILMDWLQLLAGMLLSTSLGPWTFVIQIDSLQTGCLTQVCRWHDDDLDIKKVGGQQHAVSRWLRLA